MAGEIKCLFGDADAKTVKSFLEEREMLSHDLVEKYGSAVKYRKPTLSRHGFGYYLLTGFEVPDTFTVRMQMGKLGEKKKFHYGRFIPESDQRSYILQKVAFLMKEGGDLLFSNIEQYPSNRHEHFTFFGEEEPFRLGKDGIGWEGKYPDSIMTAGNLAHLDYAIDRIMKERCDDPFVLDLVKRVNNF